MTLASSNVGSLGGLTALRDGLCHVAGSHLLDPETGEYTLPYLERLLPGREVAVVRLVHREQGLIVAPGNPTGTTGIEDVAERGLRYVNRQRGAGTRMLLDHELARHGIEPEAIDGYAREEHTHLAVAAAVAAGRADCGLGVLAAARAFGLDFVPVAREPYDLVLLSRSIGMSSGAPLVPARVRDSGARWRTWAATTPPKWAAGSADAGSQRGIGTCGGGGGRPVADARRHRARSARRARSKTGPGVTLVSDQPARRGGRGLRQDHSRQCIAPHRRRRRLRDLHAQLRHVRRRLGDLRRRLARAVEGGRAVGGGLRLQDRPVGGELLLGEPQCVLAHVAARPRCGRLLVGSQPRRHLDQRRRERHRDRRGCAAARRGRVVSHRVEELLERLVGQVSHAPVR